MNYVWLWLQQIEWRQPLWLLLIAQPALLLLFRRLRAQRKFVRYGESHLLPWLKWSKPRSGLRRLINPWLLYSLAWLLLCAALAGPRIAANVPNDEWRSGADIMLVVDVSRSMSAQDVRPSRMGRVTIELHELLDRLHGDRAGLVVFAGRAHLLAPLSFDTRAVGAYVDSLHTGIIPSAGSVIAPALNLARRELLAHGRSARAVLLATDGDEGSIQAGAKQALDDAVHALRKADIPLYVLGVGTVEGAGIATGSGHWLSVDGQPVVTRLNESLLTRLAHADRGVYARATDDDSDWIDLYDHGMQRLSAHDLNAEQAKRIVWYELYPWLLLPALVLLVLLYIPLPRSTAAAGLGLLVAGVLVMPPPVHAANADVLRQAYVAYQRQDFARAHGIYERLRGYVARIGQASSAYRLGDFDSAVQQFTQAILVADTDADRAVALFDLGNSHFRLGDYSAAVRAYADAQRYRSAYPQARANGELAARLARLVARQMAMAGDGSGAGRGRGSERFATDESGVAGDMRLGESKHARAPIGGDGEQAAPGEALSELIARGVRRARTVSQADTTSSTDQATLGFATLAGTRAAMQRLGDDNRPLWRGLFEFEEGFPAPVTKPQPLPGVSPW